MWNHSHAGHGDWGWVGNATSLCPASTLDDLLQGRGGRGKASAKDHAPGWEKGEESELDITLNLNQIKPLRWSRAKMLLLGEGVLF